MEAVPNAEHNIGRFFDHGADAEDEEHQAQSRSGEDDCDEGRFDRRPALGDHDSQGAPAKGARATGAVGADFREGCQVNGGEPVSAAEDCGADTFNVAELCQKIDGRIL